MSVVGDLRVYPTTSVLHESPPLYGVRSPSSALLPFFGEGSPTKIDYRKGTLILTSLRQDLGGVSFWEAFFVLQWSDGLGSRTVSHLLNACWLVLPVLQSGPRVWQLWR